MQMFIVQACQSLFCAFDLAIKQVAVPDRVVEFATVTLQLAILVFLTNIAAGDDLNRVGVGAGFLGDPVGSSLRVFLLSGLHDDSVDAGERNPQPGTLQCSLDVTLITVFFPSAVLSHFTHHSHMLLNEFVMRAIAGCRLRFRLDFAHFTKSVGAGFFVDGHDTEPLLNLDSNFACLFVVPCLTSF